MRHAKRCDSIDASNVTSIQIFRKHIYYQIFGQSLLCATAFFETVTCICVWTLKSFVSWKRKKRPTTFVPCVVGLNMCTLHKHLKLTGNRPFESIQKVNNAYMLLKFTYTTYKGSSLTYASVICIESLSDSTQKRKKIEK